MESLADLQPEAFILAFITDGLVSLQILFIGYSVATKGVQEAQTKYVLRPRSRAFKVKDVGSLLRVYQLRGT